MLKPIKLNPVFKEIIWGGNKLKEQYNKKSNLNNIAESWELTVRPDGMNTIADVDYEGLTLEKYILDHGFQIVTDKEIDRFPLLIKFIDAQDNLSIQVHPDDEYALEKANSLGKTEMWYVIDAEPGAKLVYGLKPGCDIKSLGEAIGNGTVEEQLNYVNVKKGDVFFIPSGLVHAIGAGILLAEIQQNSNITYRVYDYNRLGKDGKPRELHVTDALNVIVNRSEFDIDRIRYSKEKKTNNCLASCEFFTVDKYDIVSNLKLNATKESFHSVLCLEGNAEIKYQDVSYLLIKGDSYFIPAGMGEYTIEGTAEVIISRI